MNANRTLGIFLAAGLLVSSALAARAVSYSLQGQSRGSTTWITGNLQDWRELDYIPCRLWISGSSVNNQTVTLYFPHLTGTTPGFEDLRHFAAGGNVTLLSTPQLSAPATGDWSYTFRIKYTGGSGYVGFDARLAAGAHLNTGSSLMLSGSPNSMGNLQIHKPAPGPGAPDLTVTKTGPAAAGFGEVVTYTMSYTNQATGTNTAYGVQLSDILPASLEVDPASLGNGMLMGNTIFWDVGDLAPGAVGSLSFQARVNANIACGAGITNYVQILSSEDDAVYADNASTTVGVVDSTVAATPLTNLVRAVGANATFSTIASGVGPFIYEWFKGSTAIATGTSGTLTLTNVAEADSGVYQVIVHGACGSVTNSASLIVQQCFPAVDVMLVMDRSTSMKGQPYRDALAACSNFVQNLHLGTNADQAGLASYNSTATLDQTLTNRLSVLEQAIDAIPGASGYTSITLGLQTAQNELASVRHNPLSLPVILLLSDGQPTGSDSDSQALAAAQAAKDAGTRIFTIGLGDVDPALMAGMASAPGDYFYTANSAQLTALFNAVSTLICRPPTNSAPAALNDDFATPEEVPLTVSAPGVLANDTDANGDDLTAEVLTTPSHGILTFATDGSFVYQPAANYFGLDSFTYRVSDGATNSAPALVNILVTPVNDAPVADNQSVTTPEDTAKAITLTGSDLDGDSLSFTVQTPPAHGTLSGIAPNLTYTPAANYNGLDSFTFIANDGQTNSTVATVSITVTPVNDAPVADNQSVTTPEDTAKAITLTGSDLDGDSLSFTVQTPPAHGTLSGIAPNLTYTPAANYNGLDSFTFVANDGQTNSTVATVSITVTPVNDVPVADNQSVTTPEDTAKAITLTGSDLDGDSLSFTVQTQPAHGALSGIAPNLTYTPAANYNGPDSFKFLVNDGQTNSTVATVSITVTPVNDAPVADNQSVTTPEDTAKAITLTGSDLDGDSLTFTVQTQPAHGTLSGTAPNLTYTPAANYNGLDSFTFVANDGQTNSALATVSITVIPVNDPPNTNNWAGGNYTTSEDTALTVAAPGVLAGVVDGDADTLSVAVATAVAHGSLSLNPNGSFTYQPATNFNGADSFTFSISDGQTNVGPLTVNITVLPVNDAPSFVKGVDRLLPENAPAQSIAGWASNVSAGPANEADQTVAFQVSNDNQALFAVQPAVSASGTLTFTPAAGAFGTAKVSVVARDNGGTANGGVDISAPQTFAITLNAPPTVSIVSPTNGATFIGPVDFTVLANAADADGTVVQVELFVGTNRVAQITNGGPYFTVLTNVPPGTYQLSARATDDRGAVGVSTTNTVTVLEHPPIVTVAGIHLNPRTSLYEQTLRVLNPTYNAYPAVRVFVGNLAPEVRLFNISGVLNGVPYVQSNFPVPPGGYVDIIVQYYSTGGVLPNPTLYAEIVPVEEGGGAVAVGGAAQPIRTGKMLPNGTFQLEFGTQSNRVYAVQYSTDLKTWSTTPNAVAGNGSWYVWIDNGQPNTPSRPKDAKVRFYRVLLMP